MAGTQSTKLPYESLPSPTGAKTLHIVEYLAAHPEGVIASQVARELGMTPNLVYRILQTLDSLGWATQREGSTAYFLTNHLLKTAGPQVGEESLTFASHQPLRELRDRLGETVQLLIEIDGEMSVLEQFRGNQALQVCGQVGMRVPMYSSAPGKAILAAWGEAKRVEWFRSRGRTLKKFTPHTIATSAALKKEIARIEAVGHAVDLGEGIEGIHCVAVTIADPYAQPVGAITTMAPSSRLNDDDFAQVADELSRAKQEIETRLLG